MNTPICEFVSRYAESGILRLHMPGHKGMGTLGVEARDVTEIRGADSLFEADGIIAESERNASTLFACPTFYSTEGSSLCIRAMVYLALLHAKEHGTRPLLWAARNAHKTFLSAIALLDVDVEWQDDAPTLSYLSSTVDAALLDARLACTAQKPTALYLTSPDYLGGVTDVRAVADVCHRHGVLLLVDNAHGAYLKFLPESMHPIDLGADLVCDSAHKTLPVLTGGAYLHVGKNAPKGFADTTKNALALFASTSPSYLILQSLDAANPLLAGAYRTQLEAFLPLAEQTRVSLSQAGFGVFGGEPLKITLETKPYGYTGTAVADALRACGIECEMADADHVVLMLTPAIGSNGLHSLNAVLSHLERRTPLTERPPTRSIAPRRTSIREAMLSPMHLVPIEEARGKVLASPSVSCPPAVPILFPGEEITDDAIFAFRYYGIRECYVLK